MVFCSNCGAQIKNECKYCFKCGLRVEIEESGKGGVISDSVIQRSQIAQSQEEIIQARGDAYVTIQKGAIKCPVCDGLGKLNPCMRCFGSGRCTFTTSAGHGMARDTYQCYNGYCGKCKGTGHVSSLSMKKDISDFMKQGCAICGGTGRCPECRGTGLCTNCGGKGLLPNNYGYILCGECSGSGIKSTNQPSQSPKAKFLCGTCKNPISFIPQSQRWYCYYCRRYF